MLAPSGPVLMTATGASPVVAQLLTQIGTGVAAHTGATLHTEDLAPLPARDPRGGGLAASALPLTLAGLLPAAALLLVFPTRVWLRLTALVAAAVSAAVTVALLLAYVFGSIEHNLLRRDRGADAGRAGHRAVAARASARCSAGSGWPSVPRWRCCWAIRCPV